MKMHIMENIYCMHPLVFSLLVCYLFLAWLLKTKPYFSFELQVNKMIFFMKTPPPIKGARLKTGLISLSQLISCTAILLTGCSTTGLNSVISPKAPAIPASQTFNAVQYDIQNASKIYTPKISEEIFKNGDQVTVTVNGFKEFSGVYNIDKSGEIFLGHIGQVKAAGLTIPELQTRLHQSYNTCCLVNPNISIEREATAFGKIVVDGAVNEAGVFEIDEVIKLSQAVALSGGTTEIANTETVMLARVIDGERKVSQVNLKEIQLAGASDPLIYPNDVIFVQDSKGRLLYNDFIKTMPLMSALIFAGTR